MNNETKRVDVLAVLDRQMQFTIASDYPGASDDHRDLVAARDAVAELIEAACEVPLSYDYHGNPASPEEARFIAALDRFEGTR